MAEKKWLNTSEVDSKIKRPVHTTRTNKPMQVRWMEFLSLHTFFSADELKDYLGAKISEVIKVFVEDIWNTSLTRLDKPPVILIDEVHYDKGWDLSAKIVYDQTKRIFLLLTGSSALSIVQWMVSKSIEAFETRNVELAKEVIKKDDEIDELYNESLTNAAQIGKVKDVRCLIADILVIRYLERIGDHACQIASAVEYVVEGKYLPT